MSLKGWGWGGDTAWTCTRSKATDAKKRKSGKKKNTTKKLKNTHAQTTGAAAGTRGWHILDRHPPFLDEEGKDKSVKAKGEYV